MEEKSLQNRQYYLAIWSGLHVFGIVFPWKNKSKWSVWYPGQYSMSGREDNSTDTEHEEVEFTPAVKPGAPGGGRPKTSELTLRKLRASKPKRRKHFASNTDMIQILNEVCEQQDIQVATKRKRESEWLGKVAQRAQSLQVKRASKKKPLEDMKSRIKNKQKNTKSEEPVAKERKKRVSFKE